jgi:hypothetical protein
MLKWLKDELVQQLVAEVRRNAKRFDAIIETLRAQAGVAAELKLVKEELSTVHGLVSDILNRLPERPKMKGTIMADYQIPDDQPDGKVTFHLDATDTEGQAITDPEVLKTLTFEVVGSNDDAFKVTLDTDQPDPVNRTGNYHVGAPGQAAVTSNLKDADGNIIGTGTDGFTVTTGKVALGSVKSSFEGLTPIGE